MYVDSPAVEFSANTAARGAGSATRKIVVFSVIADFTLGSQVGQILETQGYLVRWFREPSEVIPEAIRIRPALFVVDTVLPGKNSFDLCRQIRQTRDLGDPRILFITNGSASWDGVDALELGGDAFVSKPINSRELTARIKAILRQASQPEPPRAERFGRIEIDSLALTIKVDDQPIRVTIREFQLLQYLARRPSRVFTRSQLLDAVWAEGAFVTQRSVDVYVRRLREKIEPDPRHPIYLISVRGVGYRFEVPS
jgi:two-component system phosphate regulon response regulator PhoB